MSVSKKWVGNRSNRKSVVRLYRHKDLLTLEAIADRLQTTFHNVQHVVRSDIPMPERKALAALRYSASKEGAKNPMKGRSESKHPQWKGTVSDGRGYLTRVRGGRRSFVHRQVLARALGVQELPEWAVIHHIDGNPKNNALDNLAVTTAAGHARIHSLQVQDSKALQLKKSTLAAAIRSMT